MTSAYFGAALSVAIFVNILFLLIVVWRACTIGLESKKLNFFPLISFAFILVIVGLTFYFWRKDTLLRGEDLHLPLSIAIILSGLIAGGFHAKYLKRLAFLDAFFIVALFSWIAVIRAEQMPELLAYGSSVAYFALLIVSAYLMLLLSLTVGGSIGYIYLSEKGSRFLGKAYESFLGKRFLMAKRSGHVVSLITIISVFAVSVGAAGMIVVMSVMNGFSDDLRAKIIGTNASLIVFKYGQEYTDYPEVMDKLKAVNGVLGATPFVMNEVMISSESNLSGAVIKGISPESIGEVSSLPSYMVDGSIGNLADLKALQVKKHKVDSHLTPLEKALALSRGEGKEEQAEVELPGIILGQEMANGLHVMLGDTVNVVSPVGEMGPTGPVPKAKAFRVVGLFFSGMYEYDAKFTYIALDVAQQFFTLGKSVTGVEAKVDNIDSVKGIAHSVSKKLGGYPYQVKDWIQMNQNIFSALRLEKIAMFIILTSAIFMASLLILVTLIMVVLEKGKEIAILKSMGATDASIMKIFVTYGTIIGSFGALLGVTLGVVLCKLIAYFGIGLDAQVYYITHLPVKVDPFEVLIVAFAVLLISFLATIPPARYAARLKPVDGLRLE